jgi:pimeloyl-ACP methyl ester carboxylesterase
MLIRILAAGLLLAAAPAVTAAQEHTAHGDHGGHGAHRAEDGRMPLLEGLGRWSWQITTASPSARQYFDQGLRLAYGFAHDDAALSFEQALRDDPSCAMCAWGIAYAVGPNINLPMSPEAEVRALSAIRRAQSLAGGVSARERGIIEAAALRFGEPAGADRAARDSAYAAAMGELARTYPNDADVQVLFADAMLNLRPWNQWTRAGDPQPGTLEVVQALESVIEREPEHAGACHFYVHAVEASQQPDRALPCAKRLPKLMPGAGHVVHMPAHVYLRVGQYEEAARANIAAVEADRRYFAARDVAPGVYPMFYAPHNLHFLWAAYLMSGQKEKAVGAARALVGRTTAESAEAIASLQAFLTTVFLTHARFGDWDAVLAEPAPVASLRYVKGMWHYARGVAQAAHGDLLAARTELDSVRAIEAEVPADMIIILNPAPNVLRVARLVLEGRIAAASGDAAAAVELLRTAAALEDELSFDEPPAWYEPVRQVLGSVLLSAHRATEAEAVFRDDLRWVRENGWSLAGLEQALRVQGRTAEAADVSRRLAKAWQYADVEPTQPVQRTRFDAALLPTGVKLSYAEAGDLRGDAVILLHGLSDSWFSWSQVMALLPEGVRAIAPDLRGHGRTEYSGSDFSMSALAADVVALMDRLGVIRATIVGHSMGSMVAQALAVEHPERVARVVLVGAIDRGAHPAAAELHAIVQGLPDPVPDEFIREFQVSTAHAPVPVRFIETAISESRKLGTPAWRGLITGLVAADFTARLPGVAVPALLLWGEKDAFFQLDAQQNLLGLLPNARLVRYEDTGHALHWERSGRFVNDLLSFMATGVSRK